MAEDGVAQVGFLLAVLCPGALNDIANFTSDGQATSQRLQLMQYFSASSYSAPSFRRRRSPSGPACFGPG